MPLRRLLLGVALHLAKLEWPVDSPSGQKLRPTQVDASLARQPCSILELDQTRCHWPLGDIEAVAVLFCGGVAVPGRCYCAHHLWIARGQGSASKRSVLSSHHAA